jgi:GAF domain-containing protein
VSLSSTDLVEVKSDKPPTPPRLPPRPPRPAAPRAGRPPAPAPALPSARRPDADDLDETLAALDAEPDALAAARACLDALAKVFPCRASLVHAFDEARGDFLVVHARGEGASSMVLERAANDDPLLRVAMPCADPFPWNDLRKAPVNRLARFSDLANVHRVLVCPVLRGARRLGVIELVDPAHGGLFRTADINAARQVADRYARYVAARGSVLDISAIARRAFG